MVVGAALTILGIALSWPAAVYFKAPALQPVMAWLSVGFLLRAFGLTQAALAQRELKFRALAIRDLTANILGGVVGIGLALAGYGVWSLVIMTLVSALLETVLLWSLAHWRPRRFEISREATADLWPYSSRMLSFNLFKAFAQYRPPHHRPPPGRPGSGRLYVGIPSGDLPRNDDCGCNGRVPVSEGGQAAV